MDDALVFPEWMIQYNEALKVVDENKRREEKIKERSQVQGSSVVGNLSEPIFSRPGSSHENVDIKYLHLKEVIGTSSPKRKNDSISNLLLSGEIAVECERLLNVAVSLQAPLVLGLDLDWPSTYTAFLSKTSSVHLCYGENQCLLFEVIHVQKLPLVFIKLIKHPNVKLIGHNIVEDLLKLGKDFNFDVKQVISSNLILSSPVDRKLSCKHHWTYNSNSNTIACKDNQVDNKESIDYLTEYNEPQNTAQFNGTIKYYTSFEDCAVCSEELLIRADYSEQLVLGFDLEWPFNYRQGSGKVALIQICPDETICYLFYVFQLKYLPKALVLLLGHSNVRLSGLNIANDIRKLGRDFNVDFSDVLRNNLIELCTLANGKLRCQQRWSLAGLVANLLKLELDKGPVRVSNWAKKDLSYQQLLYAATDAYVRSHLFIRRRVFILWVTMMFSAIFE